MVIPKPPKSTLVDSFMYFPYVGNDDYGKSLFGDGIDIRYVRIDKDTMYSSSSAGKEIDYNAVIFCYEGLTEPLTSFTEQSKVVFDGVDHIVTKVITNKEPYSSKLYSVELEVV